MSDQTGAPDLSSPLVKGRPKKRPPPSNNPLGVKE